MHPKCLQCRALARSATQVSPSQQIPRKIVQPAEALVSGRTVPRLKLRPRVGPLSTRHQRREPAFPSPIRYTGSANCSSQSETGYAHTIVRIGTLVQFPAGAPSWSWGGIPAGVRNSDPRLMSQAQVTRNDRVHHLVINKVSDGHATSQQTLAQGADLLCHALTGNVRRRYGDLYPLKP